MSRHSLDIISAGKSRDNQWFLTCTSISSSTAAMWIAHYASGLIAKPFAPNVPLWVLALAGAIPDASFFVLNMAGYEAFWIANKVVKSGGCFPYNADYPFSHSLLGMGILGAGLAGAWAMTTNRKATPQDLAAIVLASLSHFLLEVPTHRHDVKITPGDDVELGVGLFDYPLVTLIVEVAIFFSGLWVYMTFSPIIAKSGYLYQNWRLWAVSIFMVVQQIHFCFGSAPTNDTRWVHAPMFLFNILASCWALGKLER